MYVRLENINCILKCNGQLLLRNSDNIRIDGAVSAALTGLGMCSIASLPTVTSNIDLIRHLSLERWIEVITRHYSETITAYLAMNY